MSQACLHCRSPIADPAAPAGYCCSGCASVAALLQAGGLEQYYAFQGGGTAPVALPARPRDLAWLEAPLAQALAGARGELAQLSFDVQGLRCSGCVWLLRELFRRRPGAVEALVDPGVGRVTLTFRPAACDLPGYLRELERFGYGAGPVLKAEEDASDRTLGRLGFCVALTLNAMAFSAASYFGMAERDGLAFATLRWANLALGAAVVMVGGGEFFARAWRGLRAGLVSFELPIALGIALAFSGSLALFLRDPGTLSFFDTVDTFTTLMLVGRWLQRRVLVQNRRRLLADEGIAGLFARRLAAGRVEVVPAARVAAGDALLVPPGDLLVTPARLLDEAGSFSLDWINGESVPRTYRRGETVPAGAFNALPGAAQLRAEQPFASSSLVGLLGSGATGEQPSSYGALLEKVGRYYVPAVLALAAATLLGWLARGDAGMAVQATTAVLVVTCPCALGLAIPLAYELTSAELRRRGLFVVRPDFLDRAARVRRVAFDKTGTLTLGTLRLANPSELERLSEAELAALYNLTSRSAHPRSRCLLAALPARAARFDSGAAVTEVPGQGLELRAPDGTCFRLGRPAWLGAEAAGENDLGFAAGGALRARFAIEEQLRADARAEVAALRASGRQVVVLSGDAPGRVAAAARSLGLSAADAVGGLSPAGKARWLAEQHAERDTLVVGDGLNDRPALDAALCSGTPAVDRPTLAARADFYFLTPGLQCVREALESAQRLRRTTRVILGAALTYNALALAGSILGRVGPLSAALAMPASSLLILLYTVRSTRPHPAAEAVEPKLHTPSAAQEVRT